jgi:hypothetical protein
VKRNGEGVIEFGLVDSVSAASDSPFSKMP